MSRPPDVAKASSNNASTSFSSDRSAPRLTAFTPQLANSAASAAVCSRKRLCSTRWHPFSASPRATCLPMPRLAPVTNAHLPLRSTVTWPHIAPIQRALLTRAGIASLTRKCQQLRERHYPCLTIQSSCVWSVHEPDIAFAEIDATIAMAALVQLDPYKTEHPSPSKVFDSDRAVPNSPWKWPGSGTCAG